MKSFLIWLRRCQFPLLLLLSAAPIMLTSLCLRAPDALSGTYALFAAYALLSCLCLLAPGRRRMIAGCAASAALFLLSFALLPLRAQPLVLLVPVALAALLFYSLPLAARRYESDVPPFVYVAGIGIHVVIQFLHRYFQDANGVSPYEPVSAALTASLLGYMLLLLLSMNRISLDNASLARHHIPEGMRYLNTALTLAFLAASVLLAMTPAVIHSITLVWNALLRLIASGIRFLLSLLPAADFSADGMGGGIPGMMTLPEGQATLTPFSILVEKIASVLTMLIVIAGVISILYLLYRLLSRLVRALFARLRQYMTAATAEYVDEITDTREDGAQREIRFLRRRRAAVQQDTHTPAGRIRQSYARLLHRRPQWSSSSTARENLPQSAASIYERARYSEHPVTPEDADRFTSEIRKA